jgi:prepilin-type N-terminal cleavage/methylation domain-containing protein
MVKKQGFTLTEVLIVVSILVIIVLLLLLNLKTQVNRANDAKRKTDLNKIQKTFEEYFNDKQCYPQQESLGTCGSNMLSPYMTKVPCDPVTKKPYIYVIGVSSLCNGYRVCTKLEDLKDPDIARIGCDPVTGCGWAPGYNYCVSVGNGAVNDGSSGGIVITGGPTPTPTPLPGGIACTPGGRCNAYAHPEFSGCPVTYQSGTGCYYMGVFQCDSPVNRCKQ